MPVQELFQVVTATAVSVPPFTHTVRSVISQIFSQAPALSKHDVADRPVHS